ncbi:MAG: acyltransferase family protein [Lachnospiraceae bacterium]|nr:acyltransferase family protein [Lachnospiraceae bacterium]
MENKRDYISVLNVIACLAVVMMHVNNCGMVFSMEPYWISGIIIEGICNFAVPVFFMISGATLIDYRSRYNTTTFFKKRFLKTVVPFVVWSFFGMAYCIYTKQVTDLRLSHLLLGIVNVEFVNIYWFFIPLFMAYLTIPVLSRIEEKKTVYLYMILMGAVIEFFIPFLSMIQGVAYNDFLHTPMFSGWIIYLIVGYYIEHYPIPAFIRYLIYFGGVIGLLLMIVGTIRTSYAMGGLFGGYKGFINFPVLLYSSAIFLAFKQLTGTGVEKALAVLTKPFVHVTFGVYLLHRFILEMVYRFVAVDTTSLAYRLLGSVAVFVISAMIVRVMQRIPVLRRIVP